MILPAKTHVAVLDGEKFLLMRNAGTATEPKLQMEGKPDIRETNYSAGIRHQDGSPPDSRLDDLEELAHAAGIAEWINQKVLKHEISKLVVIADPGSLGELRHHWHKETEKVIVAEMAKDLVNSPANDILKAIEAA